jgi:hypothetical protein
VNPYLAKLRARDKETSDPQEPSKPSKPIMPVVTRSNTTDEKGFDGFEGDEDSRSSGNEWGSVAVRRPPSDHFWRTFEHLESRCPNLIPNDCWQLAIQDGRRFLVKWGERAEVLGWTARDLFGLTPIPDSTHPTYQRLSRYDETGLIWLLRGRKVLALTESTAAVESPTGAVTVYRRHNKPALGPLGDSLEDLLTEFDFDQRR